MSNKKFEILYQSKTIFVILNVEENEKNIFNKFIEQLKKELDINDQSRKVEFKLMTLNTSEMYLIVNEENFESIANEKTQEGIIKLFLDIIDENKEENIEQEEIKKIEEEEEDFKETISLSSLNNNNNIINEGKIENKIINDQEENNINNDNNNINIINNEDNFNNNIKEEINIDVKKNDLEKNSNIITDDLSTINTITEENPKSINEENNIIKINNKENNQIILNQNIDNNDININQELESCTICSKQIKTNIKYDCCICDHCILCENCEKIHEHPCIKFKKDKNFLKNLKECHSFLSQKEKFDSFAPTRFFKGIFNKTYDIIIQLDLDNHIEFGNNQIIEIPFKIKNLSKLPVSSNDIIIIVKNFSIVNITYDNKEKYEIKPESFIKKILKCQSGDKMGRETINLEVYSTSIKIRESPFTKEDIEITISNDKENLELNKKFTFYPKIVLLNKLRKKMLLYIIENHFVEKSVPQIYDGLCRNKWDLDATIKQLIIE